MNSGKPVLKIFNFQTVSMNHTEAVTKTLDLNWFHLYMTTSLFLTDLTNGGESAPNNLNLTNYTWEGELPWRQTPGMEHSHPQILGTWCTIYRREGYEHVDSFRIFSARNYNIEKTAAGQ